MDTQQIEILGRNCLIDELVRADVEVATPLRDHGVDLIAYIDISEQTNDNNAPHPFFAVPIQMKTASTENFSLSQKYERISNLLLVYVWNIASEKPSEFYALTYQEAFGVAEASGWTQTASWKKGNYATTSVSAALRERLQPYRMTTDRWKQVIRRAAATLV